jgi:hypothetical protein
VTRRTPAWSVLLLALLVATACDPADEKAFDDDGAVEKKPPRTQLDPGLTGGRSGASTGGEPIEAASIRYHLRVTSSSGVDLCQGEARMTVMSDFSLVVPEGTLACQSLVIDLHAMLGDGFGRLSGADGSSGGADGAPNVTHDGKMLYVRSLMGADFTPPRPLVIGPVVQDPLSFDGFHQRTEHAARAKDDATGATRTAKGSFDVTVLAAKTTYRNKYLDETFDSVLQWRLEAKGFDGLGPGKGLTLKRIEWLWSTRPIMIPQLTVVGALDDFIDDSNGAGDSFLGETTLTLAVKSYDVAK